MDTLEQQKNKPQLTKFYKAVNSQVTKLCEEKLILQTKKTRSLHIKRFSE